MISHCASVVSVGYRLLLIQPIVDKPPDSATPRPPTLGFLAGRFQNRLLGRRVTAPSASSSPKPTQPNTGGLKPVKLSKPEATKPPQVKLPVLLIGQRVGFKAKYPH